MATVCGISSVGRAVPCQGTGRRFEPDIPLQIMCEGHYMNVRKHLKNRALGPFFRSGSFSSLCFSFLCVSEYSSYQPLTTGEVISSNRDWPYSRQQSHPHPLKFARLPLIRTTTHQGRHYDYCNILSAQRLLAGRYYQPFLPHRSIPPRVLAAESSRPIAEPAL